MKTSVGWRLFATLSLVFLAIVPQVALASDHADPTVLVDPNANITGLFFFPKGDQMITILNVRRSLTAPKPYDLGPYEFIVNMDLHSKISLDDPANNARYGGTVVNPGGISPDVRIKFRLNDDTTVKSKTIEGLKNPESIRIWTGVRDDPFIFPRFFKRNVISMVMSIPMSCFPPGQQDWLLWGVTTKNGEHSDHVGRSNRTQLVRYQSVGGKKFVNDLEPKDHVPAIMKAMKSRNDLYMFLKKYKQTLPASALFQSEFLLRSYDVTPDVMLYTTRNKPAFPNGRQLEDDVAHITCEVGDCILQELSFIEGGWPRATKNDKAFLPDFPYLADPWPDSPEPAPPKSLVPYIILWVVIILLIVSGIPLWIGYIWGRKNGRRAAA